MRTLSMIAAVVAAALCSVAAQCADVTEISKDEETAWIRYTVPLPKSISIPEKVSLAKVAVGVAPPAERDMVVDQAITELAEMLGEGSLGKPPFMIVMELGGEDAKPLAELKNCDQAYRIFPVGKEELKLVALKPAGLYYAAKTLQQLIKAKATADKIEIPLVTVTDWPDLEDRGLWGSDNYDAVEWLADRKMNWMEQISDQRVEKGGKPIATIKGDREPLVYDAPQRAIKFVPVILHLEQVSGKGILQNFPWVKGKSRHEGVMCYSQPKVVEIISEWIAQLASIPHVNEVDVWMSENLGQVPGCQCRRCAAKNVDPMVLEARAIIKAWRDAQEKLGRQIGLRILTSEATAKFNTVIFSELPKEVKVVYYHSLGTYTCDKRPMMPKYLADFAKSGQWVATCPNIGAIVGYVQPFESAQFIRYRVSELVNNSASGILGYATPLVRVVRYNVEALAEYAWNVKGRSTREFAYSWAVRNGLKDPEKFADFRETVGPVEWNYNGDDWPMRTLHRRLVPPLEEMLRQGKLPPFGYYIDGFVKCPFGAYTAPSELKRDVVRADEAMKLAQEMGVEEFIQEGRVAQGYITALDALYELSKLVRNEKVAPEDRAEATRYFQAYVDGFRQAIDGVTKWNQVFFPPRPGDTNYVKPKPAQECEELVKRMTAVAGELGIQVQ